MLTRRRFTVGFAVALAFVLAALVLRSGRLALLAVPPLFYSASLLLSFFLVPRPAIEARRQVDRARGTEEESLEIVVAIGAHDRGYPLVFAVDTIPDGMQLVSGNTCYRGPIDAGEPRPCIQYTLQGTRGVYALRSINVLVWSQFGLAAEEISIETPTEIRLLPQSSKLGPIEIRPRKTRAFAGPIRSNVPGRGIDFYGCRTFSEGDDIRRIHWRAYARTGDLVICDFEQERIADVSLILDARARAHAITGPHHTFEYATRAVASLASSFCAQGNNVGLLVYGDVLNWVFPGFGRSQVDRIHDALAQAHLANKIAFEDLRQIPARLFPPFSQLVLVSCRLDETDIETLALLRSRGYSILFVSINTLPLELEGLPPSQETEMALRVATLRRSLYLGSLARQGVQVVDWDPSVPLREAFGPRRFRQRSVPR